MPALIQCILSLLAATHLLQLLLEPILPPGSSIPSYSCTDPVPPVSPGCSSLSCSSRGNPSSPMVPHYLLLLCVFILLLCVIRLDTEPIQIEMKRRSVVVRAHWRSGAHIMCFQSLCYTLGTHPSPWFLAPLLLPVSVFLIVVFLIPDR